MSWTFKHATTDQALSAWGFEACKLSKLNQAKGTFTARMAGDAFASLAFTYGDAVELRFSGVVKWRGFFIAARREASGPAETIELQFDDLWHKLEQAPFVGGYYGTLLFGTLVPGTSWTPDPLASQLAAIVAEADAYHGGGVMQAGTLHATLEGLQPPPTRIEGKTCADALRAVLRKAPGVVTSWDFSTSPPTLNFTRRADASAVTLALDPATTIIDGHSLVRRDDLVARGVVITWWREVFGLSVDATQDTAGETTGDNIIRLSFQLAPAGGMPTAGAPNIAQTETVESESNSWAITTAEWWQTYGGLPEGAQVLIVGAGTNSSGSTLGRIYKSGNIPGWMNRAAHLGERVITGYLTVRFMEEDETHYEDKKLEVKRSFLVTDLDGVYTNPVIDPESASEAEGAVLQLPNLGLAAVLYAGLSQLHWQGRIITTREDVVFDLEVGNVVNLTGGLAVYETMNAHVHALVYDFDAASCEISVGPSVHLAPDDWPSQQAQLSRDHAEPGLEARGTNAAGGAGAAGSVAGGFPGVQGSSPPVSLAHGPTVGWFVEKNGWVSKMEVENGVFGFWNAAETQSFKLNLSAGTFEMKHSTHEVLLNLATAEIQLKESSTVKTTLSPQSLKTQSSATVYTETTPDDVTVKTPAAQALLTTTSLAISSGGDTVEMNRSTGFTMSLSGSTLSLVPTALSLSAASNTATLSTSDGLAHNLSAGSSLVASASGLALENAGGDEVSLAAADGVSHLLTAGDAATMAAGGGFTHTASGGHTASVGADTGLQIASIGTVNLNPGSGDDFSLLDTSVCDNGEPKVSKILRTEAV